MHHDELSSTVFCQVTWGGLLGVAEVSYLLELLKDEFGGNFAILFPPKWQG